MHLLIAGGVPAADCHAQLGGCSSLFTELLPEAWAKRAGTELCREPHLRPSLSGFQLRNPSLMCNCIYLFIFLLLDAKLLTEHPPHKHPQPREDGERERVLCLRDGSGRRGR